MRVSLKAILIQQWIVPPIAFAGWLAWSVWVMEAWQFQILGGAVFFGFPLAVAILLAAMFFTTTEESRKGGREPW